MKEGKLSSALVKKLALTESVGKVMWHSLSESGIIEEYDMKFGDTIVRGILPEEVQPVVIQEHSHEPRAPRTKKKRKKK
jgi:hypothetical protein